MVHSTTCPVAPSCSMRSDGSSAASSRNATGIRSSSARLVAATAAGSSASGRAQGVTSSGASGEDSVSEVWAVASLVTTTTSPATARDFGSRSPSSGAAIDARPHVVVVGGVALTRGHAEQLEVPRHVHRPVGAQRPGEHPHEREVPDVGVRLGVDDLGDERTLGVGA